MYAVRKIRLGGRDIELYGNPGDAYFAAVEGVVSHLEPLRAWMRRNLRPDAVAIDGGGNIGLTALLMSAVLHKGHVHVFEALPANVALLRRNIEANGITNCTVVPVALGDQPGRVVMQGSGSASHVSGFSRAPPPDEATVPVRTLDSYMDEATLDRVDFIKLDVEGFEPAVLDGASRLIERFRPPVFMEFNSWCLLYIQGFNARVFAAALWSAFDVTVVDGAGKEFRAGGGDMMRFLHDNAVLHGMVDDVLLRLRPGSSAPRFAQSAMPVFRAADAQVGTLQAELASLYQSTSWRITKPLRALRRLF